MRCRPWIGGRGDARLARAVRAGLVTATLAVAAAVLPCAHGAAAAGENGGATGGRFGLELNNAVDVDGACRLSYVAVNDTGVALEKTAYEVVVFDRDERVSRFLVLAFGKLPAGKTKVVQFDLADQRCGDISRILLNDAAECAGPDGALTVCMDALEPKTRTAIAFGL